MKALVTGAAGFIGSHLVEMLVESGADVRALIRYNSRSDQGNLTYLPSHIYDSIDVVLGDLRDPDAINRAVQGITHVFHLGALIAIPYSYVNPNEFVQTNVQGTTNVLNACLRSSTLERVVTTSTSEVYGTAQYVPIDEKHPVQGQSPYSASKIGADFMSESYYRAFDLPVAILRPFNTYGPRQSMRAIIPTIAAQLLQEPVVKLGTLTPRRDLTYVGDTAKGFYLMATHERAPLGRPVNIGNGNDISIGELFDKLKRISGSCADLEHDETRVRPEKSEVLRLLCDYKLASSTLGWKPSVSLDEGLTLTLDWVRNHMGGVNAARYHV